MSWREAIDVYIKYLERGDSSNFVIKKARYDLEPFAAWAPHDPPLDREEILRYIDQLAERGLCGGSRRTKYYRIKGLYAVNEWPWPCKKRDVPRASTPRQETLTEEEMARLMDFIAESPRIHLPIRLAAMLGNRRAELVLLRRSEYRRPKIYVHVVKHGLSGWRELDDETCDMIDRHLKDRSDGYEELLVNNNGKPWKVRGLEQAIYRTLHRAEMYRKGLGWHAIRRGYVTWLHRRGVSETELTKLVGWKTPTMVHHYIQIDRVETEHKVREVHPFANKKARTA